MGALSVAMTSYYLPSGSKIGVGYQAHYMANAMVRRGHTVTMYSPCPRPEGALYQLKQVDIRPPLRTFRWAWTLRRQDFTPYDVVHFHGDDYWQWGRPRPVHVRTMHGSCLAEALHVPGLTGKVRMLALAVGETVATFVADETVGVSRNTGIALAKGEWVALLDADDLWHPRKLERVADFVSANPEAEAVCHPNWYFSAPEGPSEHVALHRDFTADSLDECIAALGDRTLAVDHSALGYRLAGNFEETLRIGSASLMSTAVVRRVLAIRAGVCPPQQSICGDWSFVVNVARLAQWAVLPERLSFYRFHSMQVSGAGCAQALFAHCVAIGLWYGGRPLRRHIGASAIFDELARYGANYRDSIQGVFWYAVRKRDWHTARLILSVAELLLPRLRDRLFVHIPPQITWRWERYILGMHK